MLGDKTVRLRVSREWYATRLSKGKCITVSKLDGDGKSGQHLHCLQQAAGGKAAGRWRMAHNPGHPPLTAKSQQPAGP